MEKDQTARTREQVAAAVRGKAEAEDREVVSQQDRVVTAYAITGEKTEYRVYEALVGGIFPK